MPRGRRRKASDDVLFKSTEWARWALAGLEREIADTKERLALLNDQAAKLRTRPNRGVGAVGRCRRKGGSASPR